MNQTTRYKLNQWDPEDRILREDFNADNAKLETALGGLNTSVSKHDGQLLGVPVLGRNLYNLFLRQKNAGQDVSWMEGLVYDDFSDQSKIESLSERMSWSPTEKRVLLSPSGGQLSGQLVTKTYKQNRRYAHAFLWVRSSLVRTAAAEFRLSSSEEWFNFEALPIFEFWSTNMAGEQCVETSYYLPASLDIYSFQIRFTLNAVTSTTYWPVKLYDYGLMLM